MDKLNIGIIKELQRNGRKSFAQIGRKVGLSAPSVAERIEKLEDAGIIKGYSVQLDFEKLGLDTQALITLKMVSGNFKSFISRLDEFPEVFDCVKVTGEYCAFLKVAVKNNVELENLIDRLTKYGDPNTSIILSSYVDRPILEFETGR